MSRPNKTASLTSDINNGHLPNRTLRMRNAVECICRSKTVEFFKEQYIKVHYVRALEATVKV